MGVVGGGGGGFSSRRNFFSFSLFFLGHSMNILGLVASMNFFSFNFPFG